METRQERLAKAAQERKDAEFEQMKRDIVMLKKKHEVVSKILRDYEMKLRQLGNRK
jgi:hypothetical protein